LAAFGRPILCGQRQAHDPSVLRADLIFDIPTLVSYCSDWTPLVAGDVISIGTPEGVGFARKPPLWMKPGDVVEVEIDGGIGVLRNPIIAES
jgi:2-keto-4-pentenoate hydratase/2-oxohepta-3-ene-1,7-dioic acid hydratase in catechol pathway